MGSDDPTPNLKKLLTIKIKQRQDSFSDQFNRLFMVKLLMVTSLITGLSWANDSINCYVPKIMSEGEKGFVKYVSNACWINGVYVYRNMTADESWYYGIPRNIDDDGRDGDGNLCATRMKQTQLPVKGCKQQTKTFYLQYQWFPLVVAALGFLYYLPYLLYLKFNSDVEALKVALSSKMEPEKLIQRFFSRSLDFSSTIKEEETPEQRRVTNQQTFRLLVTVLVKLLYIVCNIVAFIIVNDIFGGYFFSYGTAWIDWTRLPNSLALDYMAPEKTMKAGHTLLPNFAICQVAEEAADIKHTKLNVHKVVCEMSQHIMYQYALLMLWWAFVFGLVVSIVGFLVHIADHFLQLCPGLFHNTGPPEVYNRLRIRERQYLEFIRLNDFPMFGELIRYIQEARQRQAKPKKNIFSLGVNKKKKAAPDETHLMSHM